MRISDGSSDVCSSDLSPVKRRGNRRYYQRHDVLMVRQIRGLLYEQGYTIGGARQRLEGEGAKQESALSTQIVKQVRMELEEILQLRSEEHTSELQSLMRISYAVFCLKNKNKTED